MLTPAQLQTLSTELKNDPITRGYASLGDEAAAATFTLTDRSVARDSIDGGLLASCLVQSEYTALAANDKDFVRLICATATPIPLTTAFKAQLGAIFPANSGTRTRLLAAVNRSGNRAEELNIPVPTTSEVAKARGLP